MKNKILKNSGFSMQKAIKKSNQMPQAIQKFAQVLDYL
jgi:hypothetical protein